MVRKFDWDKLVVKLSPEEVAVCWRAILSGGTYTLPPAIVTNTAHSDDNFLCRPYQMRVDDALRYLTRAGLIP